MFRVPPSPPIQFYQRYTGEVETEVVYGDAFLRWTYLTKPGRLLLETVVKKSLFSKWYGWTMNRPASKAKIQPFIEQYGVDVSELLDSPESYPHFNAFFYRHLKPEARPIAGGDEVAVFPADGRHLAIPDLSQMDRFLVKGQQFDLPTLLGSTELAERYAKGTMVFSRLCPVDYHRFHFPVSGTPSEARLIKGFLYSVNPIALRDRLAYTWENKRTLTQIKSDRFGTVLFLEIGATCVGSIVQTYRPEGVVAKGDEKGYFKFGGSSTIVIFEPGRVRLDEDLLAQSEMPRELYARMGDRLGEAT